MDEDTLQLITETIIATDTSNQEYAIFEKAMAYDKIVSIVAKSSWDKALAKKPVEITDDEE